MKKKAYLKPILIGFFALYLFSMSISTYLVKEKFSNKYARNYNDMLQITEFYFNHSEIADNDAVTYMLTNYLDHAEMENKYQQFSLAIYGPDSQKYSQMRSVIYLPYTANQTYAQTLQDFLTTEEIESLLALYDNSKDWLVEAKYEKETNQLLSLNISSKSDDANRLNWNWEKNTNAKNTFTCSETYYSPRSLVRIPYLTAGIDQYKQWFDDDFLQNFPDTYKKYVSSHSLRETSGLKVHDETALTLSATDTGSGSYTLVLRSTTRPLLAALSYMKYIYPISILFVTLCVLIVIFFLNRIYKRHQTIVDARRDFTNAIAHELKTPLGIIRNFTENLLENTNPQKRTYYLKQINNQTDVMKGLTKEILYVSGLDAEQLNLTKSPLSLRTLIEEQYEKLTPLADEKNLEIRYETTQEFIINGDKIYLEKAIWNLLSNAVIYNHLDGRIAVQIDSDFCSIENTGKAIADEALPHVFDMFYTDDKSRNSSEKHLGLGLYLAKRILKLHQLNLSIENTETGVKVTIKK